MSDFENSPRVTSKGSPRFAIQSVLSALGPVLALVVVIMVFGALDQLYNEKPKFLTTRNLVVLLSQMSVVAVAALGMTLIILAGGVDLSIGFAVSLCATVLAF